MSLGIGIFKFTVLAHIKLIEMFNTSVSLSRCPRTPWFASGAEIRNSWMASLGSGSTESLNVRFSSCDEC